MVPDFFPILLEVSSEAGTSHLPARGVVLKIGRAADNDVVLSSESTVSRYHAELSHSPDGWSIQDLGSHNGTFVNGVALKQGVVQLLRAVDVIGLGTVTVRLLSEQDSGGMTVEDGRGREIHRLLTALSPREREVLTLVAAGRTDEQVANELFISIKTVHSHLDKMRDKTGVRRRAELTRLAVRLGLSRPR